jgi:hypothetical protein
MAGKTAAGSGGRPGRDDRLKAALKANMARRKAQARARDAAGAATDDTMSDKEPGAETRDDSE